MPATYDITIYRGDDFELPFFIREKETPGPGPYVDLTGWTGIAQYRAAEDEVAVLLEFTVTILDQGVALGGVMVSATDVQTAALTVLSGVYDVQLTDASGKIKTYLKGAVTVSKDVSRV